MRAALWPFTTLTGWCSSHIIYDEKKRYVATSWEEIDIIEYYIIPNCSLETFTEFLDSENTCHLMPPSFCNCTWETLMQSPHPGELLDPIPEAILFGWQDSICAS